MKIKIFVSTLLIFLLTGCTPRLTYTILDGQIKETIEIPFDDSYASEEIEQKLQYYSYRPNLNATVEVDKNDNGYNGIVNVSNMSMNAYFQNDRTLINECYKMVNFIKEDEKFYLNTSKGFQCMTYDYNIVDEVIVTIETYNKVYQHNADEVKGGKYTWNITSDNADEQSILFVVGNKEYVWYYRYQSLFIGLAIVLSLSLVVGLVIFIFKNYSNKVNKI